MISNSIMTIFFLIFFLMIFCFVLVSIPYFLNTKRKDFKKSQAYECGFAAFEDSKVRIEISYFLTALIFIIFDLELIFFLPLLVDLNVPTSSLVSLFIFFNLLFISLAIEIKTGALFWLKTPDTPKPNKGL